MWNEVVKCGLPEHKRPSEPENETNVEQCIQRITNNDPTLNTVNLNNMKRTPIPQIQRLIVALVDNVHLKQLSLANTGLSDNGAEPLIQVIRYNRGLRSLNLETNFLSGDFFARFFHYALQNEVLEEVKAVNQSATFSTSQERAIIDAIFENQNLIKVSVQMRLPESRYYIEKAMLRNADNRRKRRRALAQQNNPLTTDPRLQGLNLEFSAPKTVMDPVTTPTAATAQGSLRVETGLVSNAGTENHPNTPNQNHNGSAISAGPAWRSPQASPATTSNNIFGSSNVLQQAVHSNQHPGFVAAGSNANAQSQQHQKQNGIQNVPALQNGDSKIPPAWVIRQESSGVKASTDASNHDNIYKDHVPKASTGPGTTEPEFKTQSTFVLRRTSVNNGQTRNLTEAPADNDIDKSQTNEILQARSKLNRVEPRKKEIEDENDQFSATTDVPRPPPPPMFLIPDSSSNDRPFLQEPASSRPMITASMLQESPIFNALRQKDMTHNPSQQFNKFPVKREVDNPNSYSNAYKVLPVKAQIKEATIQNSEITRAVNGFHNNYSTTIAAAHSSTQQQHNQPAPKDNISINKEKTPPPSVLPKPPRNYQGPLQQNVEVQQTPPMTTFYGPKALQVQQHQAIPATSAGEPTAATSNVIAMVKSTKSVNLQQPQVQQAEAVAAVNGSHGSWIKQAPVTGQPFMAGPPWARAVQKGAIKIDS